MVWERLRAIVGGFVARDGGIATLIFATRHRELARFRECSDTVLSRRRRAGTAKPHYGSPRLGSS